MAAARESALAKLPLPAKVGIIVTLVVLVGVGYYVVFFGDIANRIAAEERKEQTLRDDLKRATEAQAAYQKDLAELHEREQRKGEIEKILPSQAEYPSFLSSIQGVANVSGVALTAWTPEQERPDEFYARVPMKLKLTGRYHQVAKFFYGVGQLDRIINMENISMTEPKQSDADNEVTVSVEVQATAFRSLGQGEVAGTDKTQKRGAALQGGSK
jgi:type IV pilus assembly protein PilO